MQNVVGWFEVANVPLWPSGLFMLWKWSMCRAELGRRDGTLTTVVGLAQGDIYFGVVSGAERGSCKIYSRGGRFSFPYKNN